MKSPHFVLIVLTLSTLALSTPAQAEDPPQLLLEVRGQELGPHFGMFADVATHSSGDAFLLDVGDNQVFRVRPDGSPVLNWGEWGSGPGEFRDPRGIAVDDQDRVYVADTENGRVHVCDDQGNPLAGWNAGWPWGIEVATGSFDLVLVSDIVDDRVSLFTRDGVYVASFGGLGTAPGAFDEPRDVAYDPRYERIYVSDHRNERVQFFDTDRNWLGEWGYQTGHPELRAPKGITVDTQGNVFVSAADDELLLKYDPDQNLLSTTVLQSHVEGVDCFGHGTIWTTSEGSDWVWKYGYPPAIQTIADVAPDQGKWVRLSWTPSVLDAPGMPRAVDDYAIYRRLPSLSKGMENWDCVATVPARQDPLYNAVVPTLVDSTATEGIQWSVFVVTAFGEEGSLHDCAPDSGYSVDNLAPAVPAAPLVWENHGLLELELSWTASSAVDFAYYGVYRGTTSDFPITDLHAPFATTAVPGYVDGAVAPGETWHYRVAAFDDAGMVAGASPSASAQVLTAAPVPSLERAVLDPNVPNPFNPSTRLRFHLPEPGDVTLVVHDAAGRRVATLLEGPQRAGWQMVDWTARDDAGRTLASGVYYARLKAEGFIETRKMALSK